MIQVIGLLRYDSLRNSWVGQLLAEGYINYDLHADPVIPVPLHSERQQQRGYNHAYLLAHHCAERIGV